jgi:hypothetical protein
MLKIKKLNNQKTELCTKNLNFIRFCKFLLQNDRLVELYKEHISEMKFGWSNVSRVRSFGFWGSDSI